MAFVDLESVPDGIISNIQYNVNKVNLRDSTDTIIANTDPHLLEKPPLTPQYLGFAMAFRKGTALMSRNLPLLTKCLTASLACRSPASYFVLIDNSKPPQIDSPDSTTRPPECSIACRLSQSAMSLVNFRSAFDHQSSSYVTVAESVTSHWIPHKYRLTNPGEASVTLSTMYHSCCTREPSSRFP